MFIKMTTPEVTTIAESGDKEKELKEISQRDIKDVKRLEDYYNKASEKEKQELVMEFKNYVEPDLNKIPRLKNSNEKEESAEIWNNDIANLMIVKEFRERFENALRNYPNMDWTTRQAINDMMNTHLKDAEVEIKKALN